MLTDLDAFPRLRGAVCTALSVSIDPAGSFEVRERNRGLES